MTDDEAASSHNTQTEQPSRPSPCGCDNDGIEQCVECGRWYCGECLADSNVRCDRCNRCVCGANSCIIPDYSAYSGTNGQAWCEICHGDFCADCVHFIFDHAVNKTITLCQGCAAECETCKYACERCYEQAYCCVCFGPLVEPPPFELKSFDERSE
jgi:hypothetical protein